MASLLRGLPEKGRPTLLRDPDGLPAALLPFPFLSLPGERQEAVASLSEGLETLFYDRDLRQRLLQRASGLKRALRGARERAEKKLAMLAEETLTQEQAEDLRVSGELLTASLHSIPRGADAVTLPDYYTGGERVIPLDRRQPRGNAQRYFAYRKAHRPQVGGAAGGEGQGGPRPVGERTPSWTRRRMRGTWRRSATLWPGRAAAPGTRPGGRERMCPSRPAAASPRGLYDPGASVAGNERPPRADPEDLWLHARDVPARTSSCRRRRPCRRAPRSGREAGLLLLQTCGRRSAWTIPAGW